MSKRAIVILYEGSKPSKGAIAALHTALCESGVLSNLESIEMYDMSEEEIIATLAGRPLRAMNASREAQPITPEAAAVIEMSQRYGSFILGDNTAGLQLKLSMDAMRSKFNIEGSKDPKLDEIICILARPHVIENLTFTTKKDAKLWEHALEVIRRVYETVYV